MAHLDGEPSNIEAEDEDVAKEKVTNSKGGKRMPLIEEANAATSI